MNNTVVQYSCPTGLPLAHGDKHFIPPLLSPKLFTLVVKMRERKLIEMNSNGTDLSSHGIAVFPSVTGGKVGFSGRGVLPARTCAGCTLRWLDWAGRWRRLAKRFLAVRRSRSFLALPAGTGWVQECHPHSESGAASYPECTPVRLLSNFRVIIY